MIWIGTFYGMMNDPEGSGGFETGAENAQIEHPFFITSFELTLLIVLFPFMGWASDQIPHPDKRLRVMAAGVVGLLVCSVPLFSLMMANPTTGMALVMQSIFAVFMAAIGGPMAAWFVESFPPMVRYSGVGVGYNFSQAFFGGTAPLIATALIGAGFALGPMLWMCCVCCVSLGGLYVGRARAYAQAAALVSAGGVCSDFVVAAAAASTGSASTDVVKRGTLKKLGGANKDKWQERTVAVSAREISWAKGLGAGTGTLTAGEIGSCTVWSALDIPAGFGFEVCRVTPPKICGDSYI